MTILIYYYSYIPYREFKDVTVVILKKKYRHTKQKLSLQWPTLKIKATSFWYQNPIYSFLKDIHLKSEY